MTLGVPSGPAVARGSRGEQEGRAAPFECTTSLSVAPAFSLPIPRIPDFSQFLIIVPSVPYYHTIGSARNQIAIKRRLY